jgi:hypothetical protein
MTRLSLFQPSLERNLFGVANWLWREIAHRQQFKQRSQPNLKSPSLHNESRALNPAFSDFNYFLIIE